MGIIELRICVYTFLFMQLVLVFGILRIYNALTVITKWGIKLKEVVSRLDTSLLQMTRTVKASGEVYKTSTSNVVASLSKLSKYLQSSNTVTPKVPVTPQFKPKKDD